MIYLIKSENFLKIGFTTDIYKRYHSYSVNNPNFEFLGLKEGDLGDEKYAHNFLKNYAIPNTEWMVYHKNILNYWKKLPNLNVTIPDYCKFSRATKNLAVNNGEKYIFNFKNNLELKEWKQYVLRKFQEDGQYVFDFYTLNKMFGDQFRSQNTQFTIKNMKKYLPEHKKILIMIGNKSKTCYDFS